MPLQMRLPKRGFKSPNRTSYTTLNVDQLGELAKKYKLKEVSPAILYDNKIIIFSLDRKSKI